MTDIDLGVRYWVNRDTSWGIFGQRQIGISMFGVAKLS